MQPKEFQNIADRLLQRYYGITLNDTALHDEKIVERFTAEGDQPFVAVNEWAEEKELVRIDKHGPWGQPVNIALTKQDQDAIETGAANPTPFKFRPASPSM